MEKAHVASVFHANWMNHVYHITITLEVLVMVACEINIGMREEESDNIREAYQLGT